MQRHRVADRAHRCGRRFSQGACARILDVDDGRSARGGVGGLLGADHADEKSHGRHYSRTCGGASDDATPVRARWRVALRPRRRVGDESTARRRADRISERQRMPERDARVAVVTGASSGIGRAIALALAADGADVVVNHRDSDARAREVAELITRSGRRALVVRADVSHRTDVGRLAAQPLAAFPAIGVWVNNAGADILTGEARTWSEDEKWDRVMAVDLKGTWLCTRAAAAAMAERAGGAIVNISWDHVLSGMG